MTVPKDNKVLGQPALNPITTGFIPLNNSNEQFNQNVRHYIGPAPLKKNPFTLHLYR